MKLFANIIAGLFMIFWGILFSAGGSFNDIGIIFKLIGYGVMILGVFTIFKGFKQSNADKKTREHGIETYGIIAQRQTVKSGDSKKIYIYVYYYKDGITRTLDNYEIHKEQVVNFKFAAAQEGQFVRLKYDDKNVVLLDLIDTSASIPMDLYRDLSALDPNSLFVPINRGVQGTFVGDDVSKANYSYTTTTFGHIVSKKKYKSFCPNCGAPVTGNSDNCQYCGTLVTD